MPPAVPALRTKSGETVSEHGLHGQRRVDLAHAGRSKHHPHAADPTDVQREHGA